MFRQKAQGVQDIFKPGVLSLPLSVALGAAEWNSETETLTECFSRADAKMYQNKMALKHVLHIPDYIMNRLYDRQILDKETVEFTAKMAREFALHLGLSNSYAQEIGLAAHYQDIGMAKLPESYVIRGQSMNEDETSQMNAHVTHGYSMARQFEELYKIADTILVSWRKRRNFVTRSGSQVLPLHSISFFRAISSE